MFSPVIKMTSIRTILSLVVVEYLHLEQLDVKQPFSMGIWRKIFMCSNHKGMGQREGEFGLEVEEELVWPKASSKEVVFKI